MPSVSPTERDSNRIIEGQLDERAAMLEDAADADVLSYLGPMFPPGDDVVKDVVEARLKRRRQLMVLLETGGGLITVAERIARIFRHHYRRVDFVVPTYAMSAGTVLVMSGDAISMDYASTLGPIDPQVRSRTRYVPALGYLEQSTVLSRSQRRAILRLPSWPTSSRTSTRLSYTSMSRSANYRSRYWKSGSSSTSSRTGR